MGGKMFWFPRPWHFMFHLGVWAGELHDENWAMWTLHEYTHVQTKFPLWEACFRFHRISVWLKFSCKLVGKYTIHRSYWNQFFVAWAAWCGRRFFLRSSLCSTGLSARSGGEILHGFPVKAMGCSQGESVGEGAWTLESRNLTTMICIPPDVLGSKSPKKLVYNPCSNSHQMFAMMCI